MSWSVQVQVGEDMPWITLHACFETPNEAEICRVRIRALWPQIHATSITEMARPVNAVLDSEGRTVFFNEKDKR